MVGGLAPSQPLPPLTPTFCTALLKLLIYFFTTLRFTVKPPCYGFFYSGKSTTPDATTIPTTSEQIKVADTTTSGSFEYLYGRKTGMQCFILSGL